MFCSLAWEVNPFSWARPSGARLVGQNAHEISGRLDIVGGRAAEQPVADVRAAGLIVETRWKGL
ncbi:hypothetical protein B1812_11505 [Methylocystis bryophila]|uniref:Uncharacterized protein n=1 Tax=Methylocystis bryophila TaxID=655015 RepID=A0A1W6MVG8_9HYPH|nr:hypothetical protein B1812_11505 [Methylocystis bryophila]